MPIETNRATTLPVDTSAPQPVSMSSTRQRNLTWWLVLLLVWASSALYTAKLLKRGWVPHDEGTIGQSAERVLDGQLPHRDFDDPYTGGLSYLNALAFRLLGTNSASPRIVLFLFFLGFVPAMYAIASRFASPLGAGGVTLLSVAWSLPNYTAAVPSWYGLFFAVFGTGAVLRYLETDRRYWLFLAGLCGGLSFLFKLSGIYFIAAVLLLLVFRELCTSPEVQRGTLAGERIYSIFLKASFAVFIAALFNLIRPNFSVAGVIEFGLPGVALVALCLSRDWKRAPAASARRFGTLFQILLPFAVGVALPIVIFLVPYIRSGSLSDFFRGVFLLPTRRFGYAARIPTDFGLNRIIAISVFTVLLVAAAYLRKPLGWPTRALLLLGLALVLIGSTRSSGLYEFAWDPLPTLIPFTVLAGALLLGRPKNFCALSAMRQQQIMLLLSVAALCSLIQVPFTIAVYFCYVAPLLVLALLALFSTRPRSSRFILASLLVFYIAFAVFRSTPTFLSQMGIQYLPDGQTYHINLARAGGLRVYPEQGHEYDQLIPLVQEHAAGSSFVYCAPDCPEVSFLAGLRDPTRTLFDFFDEPAGHTQRVLRAIDSHGVKVVAILTVPDFSKPMPADLRTALRERFPEYTRIGRFEARWRQ